MADSSLPRKQCDEIKPPHGSSRLRQEVSMSAENDENLPTSTPVPALDNQTAVAEIQLAHAGQRIDRESENEYDETDIKVMHSRFKASALAAPEKPCANVNDFAWGKPPTQPDFKKAHSQEPASSFFFPTHNLKEKLPRSAYETVCAKPRTSGYRVDGNAHQGNASDVIRSGVHNSIPHIGNHGVSRDTGASVAYDETDEHYEGDNPAGQLTGAPSNVAMKENHAGTQQSVIVADETHSAIYGSLPITGFSKNPKAKGNQKINPIQRAEQQKRMWAPCSSQTVQKNTTSTEIRCSGLPNTLMVPMMGLPQIHDSGLVSTHQPIPREIVSFSVSQGNAQVRDDTVRENRPQTSPEGALELAPAARTYSSVQKEMEGPHELPPSCVSEPATGSIHDQIRDNPQTILHPGMGTHADDGFPRDIKTVHCQVHDIGSTGAQDQDPSVAAKGSFRGSSPRTLSGNLRPHRINKPRNTRNTPNRSYPTSARSIGGSPTLISSPLQILESLHMSLVADKYRKDHEHKTELRHAQEVRALLESQVQAHISTIADWKQRCTDLQEKVDNIRSRANANQKYISGLQNDHEKLQKLVSTCREECKKELKYKVSEVERDKADLLQDFERTLDTLSNYRKSSKKMVDDFYARLIQSESERNQLSKRLEDETRIHSEEITRRKELESKIFISLGALMEQISGGSTRVGEKLETLRELLESSRSDEDQRVKMDEYLHSIRKLQEIPFLTKQDAQKAEYMLRYTHNSIESRLKEFSENIKSPKLTLENLRGVIQDQVQALRTEFFHHEELNAESQRLQHDRIELDKDLEDERQRVLHLKEQLETMRCTKDRLQEQSAQLEAENAALSKMNHEKDASTMKADTEIADLTCRLKELKGDLQASNKKSEDLDQDRRSLKEKLEVVEKQNGIIRGKAAKLNDAIQQINLKSMDEASIRQSIESQCRQEFAGRECDLKNEVFRLKTELTVHSARLQERDEQLSAAKFQFEQLQKQANESVREILKKQSEKQALENRLNGIQSRIENSNIDSSNETVDLQGQLDHAREELRSKTRECEECNVKLADLEAAFEQLHAENLQPHLDVQSVRAEAETEQAERSQKTQAQAQAAEDKFMNLRSEIEELESRLAHAQNNEAAAKELHAATCLQLDSVRARVTELGTIRDSYRAQLSTLREENDQMKQKWAKNVEELRSEVRSSNAALKEAKAKNQLQEEEHSKKIEFDRQKYEEKFETFRKEAKTFYSNSQQRNESRAPALRIGNRRRAVNRDNQSALDVAGISGVKINSSQGILEAGQGGKPGDAYDDHDYSRTLFDEEEQLKSRESPKSGHSKPVNLNQPRELALSSEDFRQQIGQACRGEEQRQASSSSSSLSVLDSDDFNQLEQQAYSRQRTPVSASRQFAAEDARSCELIVETPVQSLRTLPAFANSQSSTCRPRSQANTASRMMPPAKDSLQAYDTVQTSRSKLGQTLDQSQYDDRSSPDYLHPVSSRIQHGYHYQDRRLGHTSNGSPLAGHHRTHGSKRQHPPKEDTFPKRLRLSASKAKTSQAKHLDGSSNVPASRAVTRDPQFASSPLMLTSSSYPPELSGFSSSGHRYQEFGREKSTHALTESRRYKSKSVTKENGGFSNTAYRKTRGKSKEV